MNFSCRKRSTSCGLLDLLLDVQVLVVRDLLGDQRAEDLPADLHQLARGQVALQHPVVGAALVGGGLGGASALPSPRSRPQMFEVRR